MEDLVMPASGFWRNKRVLITGHTGFKGAWLSLWLEHLGARVVGVALPPATRPSLFEAARIGERIESTFGDIRDAAFVARTIAAAEPEVIFHLAAQSLVRASYSAPVATYETNVMGTIHVLEAARTTPSVRAIVNVTSDKCYENREWPWPYRETEAMGGYDPYSSSKAASEIVTAAWRRSFFSAASPPVGLATGRAGNVVGGGDWAEDRLVPDCMRALAADRVIDIRFPGAVRPWQHVLEPLCGYLLLAQRLWEEPAKYAEAWNFGPADEDAKPVSWVVSEITSLWGDGAAWRLVGGKQPHEATYLRVDASKARSGLNWRPRLPLSECLAWTVDWYRGMNAGEAAAGLTLAQIKRYEAIGHSL